MREHLMLERDAAQTQIQAWTRALRGYVSVQYPEMRAEVQSAAELGDLIDMCVEGCGLIRRSGGEFNLSAAAVGEGRRHLGGSVGVG